MPQNKSPPKPGFGKDQKKQQQHASKEPKAKSSESKSMTEITPVASGTVIAPVSVASGTVIAPVPVATGSANAPTPVLASGTAAPLETGSANAPTPLPVQVPATGATASAEPPKTKAQTKQEKKKQQQQKAPQQPQSQGEIQSQNKGQPNANPSKKQSKTDVAGSKSEKKKGQGQQQQQQPQKQKQPQKQQQQAKKKSEKPGSKAKGELTEKEEVFQAVVLADNFSFSIFGPECPLKQEGFINLANRKIIDYTLEALTMSGVQEIYLYCSNEAESIRDYIKNSAWSSIPNCAINIIVSEDALSLGDALRDIDAKGVIKNDFILLSSGVVTNLALKPFLNIHRETAKVDKGAVMTLIHRKMLPGHRSRSKLENKVLVVNSATKKIIAYDWKTGGRKLNIPLEGIQDEMDIYTDSVDSGIVVCSSAVPPLFTDNFDFTCINDFVRGIMINEEILGNSIYLQRIEIGYANRIIDFSTYHGICCDILQRWTYPIVPDMTNCIKSTGKPYDMHNNFVYRGENVMAASGSEIGKSVILGENSVIEKGAEVTYSVLGNNCRIESGAKVINSHLGNNVHIKRDCIVNRCIIMEGVSLTDTTPINETLIMDKGEKYPILLPTEGAEDEDESDEDSSSSETDVQGPAGDEFDSDDESDHGMEIQEDDFIIFSQEVMESLIRGFRQNVAIENLVLEINSSKYAYNMSFKDVAIGLTKGILTVPTKIYPEFFQGFTQKVQLEKTKEVIAKLKGLFSHYVKTNESQKDLLQAIEEYANDNQYFRPMLMQSLHLLYDEDILSEEAIIKWHKSPSLYEAGKDLRILVKKLVDWLEAPDSESGED